MYDSCRCTKFHVSVTYFSSAVWRWPDQVWVSSVRLQPGARAQVHLAGGDRKEALQHRLGLLQVTKENNSSKSIHLSYFPVTPPRFISPTAASVSATRGSSSAPSTTLPRAPRRAPRLRVSGHKARLMSRGIGQIMSLLWHHHCDGKSDIYFTAPCFNFSNFCYKIVWWLK